MKSSIILALMLLGYATFAQPVNDDPCGAIVIPIENLGCEPTITYSYSAATHSAAYGNTYCNSSPNRDVWYKFTVPSNGMVTVRTAYATTSNITVEMYKSTSCNALTILNQNLEGFPCLYVNTNDVGTFTSLIPGSIVYMRVYALYDMNIAAGSVKICVSNTNGLADEPCNAGFFPVYSADPLGQNCVPDKMLSWSGATLTPAVPTPGCGVINPSNVRDVWFKVRIPASGKLSFGFTDVLNTCAYACPFIAVYSSTACNGTFTEIYCGFYGHEFTGLTPNSILYFRVYIYSSSVFDYGSIKLCVADKNSVPSVNNSSRIGIGIDTPFAKLDVVGTGIFRDKVTAGSDVEVRGNLIVQGNILGKYGTAVLKGNTSIQGGALTIDSMDLGNQMGNRIALWGGLGNSPKYGMGIQGGLLQMYAGTSTDNIAFGYGNSYNFNERMRIINTGADGLSLNGRIHLKNGTADVNNGGGVWLYRGDNAGLLGFMGTQNNQNIGFYGGPGGWGFTYDAVNSRVGIGNNSPQNPLSFAQALGKKISLYPGVTGDVGMAVQGNYLQIYSDNPFASVGLGYQQNSLISGGNPTGFQYNLDVYGNGNAQLRGTLTQLSDARFKKDVTHLENSLQKIIQLNGYNYYWKNENSDNGLQTGILAQDVQKLFPFLVKEDKQGMLSVNYSGLIPILIESIKEQQKQIDALLEHDKDQQKQIDALIKLIKGH